MNVSKVPALVDQGGAHATRERGSTPNGSEILVCFNDALDLWPD
jgi:hypothetical protein